MSVGGRPRPSTGRHGIAPPPKMDVDVTPVGVAGVERRVRREQRRYHRLVIPAGGARERRLDRAVWHDHQRARF